MSRNAPVITACSISSESLVVAWEIDEFYPDPEVPDAVNILVNGHNYNKGTNLPPATETISIPLSSLNLFGTFIVLEVQFVWHGGQVLVSSVSMRIGDGEGASASGRSSAPAPSLSILEAKPKTLHHENYITLSYTSYNWNKGKIEWGASGQQKKVDKIKPKGGIEASYSGVFVTNRPLHPDTVYDFNVSVTNGFEAITGTSSLSFRSASNIRSMQMFLRASGIVGPTSARTLGMSASMRAAMGI